MASAIPLTETLIPENSENNKHSYPSISSILSINFQVKQLIKNHQLLRIVTSLTGTNMMIYSHLQTMVIYQLLPFSYIY